MNVKITAMSQEDRYNQMGYFIGKVGRLDGYKTKEKNDYRNK